MNMNPRQVYIQLLFRFSFWEFNQPFIQQIIPVTYTSMMQYVDFLMIDTTASIFTGKETLGLQQMTTQLRRKSIMI